VTFTAAIAVAAPLLAAKRARERVDGLVVQPATLTPE
jgi:hypothetical protein